MAADVTETAPLLGAGTEEHSYSTSLDEVPAPQDACRRRNIVARAFVPEWVSFDMRRIIGAYRFRSLVAVKPLEKFMEERDARPEGRKLAESLGVIDLLGYGVGSTVGAGIYSLIGVAAGIAGESRMLPCVHCMAFTVSLVPRHLTTVLYYCSWQDLPHSRQRNGRVYIPTVMVWHVFSYWVSAIHGGSWLR